MKKSEYIERYGEEEYKRRLEYMKVYNREINRKGGKHYDKTLKYDRTGLRGERNAIRNKHQKQYRLYKNIIAPDSQIHHEWIPKTAEYRGLALVEAMPHQYGIIDVIQILDGEITLLTEEEVKEEEEMEKNEQKQKGIHGTSKTGI